MPMVNDQKGSLVTLAGFAHQVHLGHRLSSWCVHRLALPRNHERIRGLTTFLHAMRLCDLESWWPKIPLESSAIPKVSQRFLSCASSSQPLRPFCPNLGLNRRTRVAAILLTCATFSSGFSTDRRPKIEAVQTESGTNFVGDFRSGFRSGTCLYRLSPILTDFPKRRQVNRKATYRDWVVSSSHP